MPARTASDVVSLMYSSLRLFPRPSCTPSQEAAAFLTRKPQFSCGLIASLNHYYGSTLLLSNRPINSAIGRGSGQGVAAVDREILAGGVCRFVRQEVDGGAEQFPQGAIPAGGDP